MPKPPYVEKANELLRELTRLTPLLKERVEEARQRREPLDPRLVECLTSAFVLKGVIRDLEEEVGRFFENNQLV
jgi:hypothetical protein